MEIIVLLRKNIRGTEEAKNWKAPFKKLKLSEVRAEDDEKLLLKVAEKEVAKVIKLIGDRFVVETVIDEGVWETWEMKIALLGQKKKAA